MKNRLNIVLNKKKKKHFSVLMLILFILLVLWTAILFFSLGWAVISSFKEGFFDFRNNLFGLPEKWVTENYTFVFKEMYVVVTRNGSKVKLFIEDLFLNSIIFTLACAFTSTIVPCLTAYVTSRYSNWWSSKLIYFIVIFCMAVPIVGTQASELQMTMKLGVYDTIFVGPFLKSSFLGMYFILFYGIFKSQAKEYTEAALLDGANQWQIMYRVALPLVGEVFGIIFLLQIIAFWKDFETSLLFMPDYPTVSLGLFMFTESMDTDKSNPTVQFAASILIMLPVLILFLIFSDKIIGRVSINGGLKG